MSAAAATPIYLDHNATTAPSAAVIAAITECLAAGPCNASAVHSIGQRAKHRLNDARERIAKVLGVGPHEIVFTGSGTEADNLAVLGFLRQAARLGDGPRVVHLVTTTIEHPAVREAARVAEAETMRVTRVAPEPSGIVAAEAVLAEVDTGLQAGVKPADTLVSVIAAHNETGALQPIAAIGAGCRARGVTFHTDAVQLFGKRPFMPAEVPCDLAVLAPHKFHGPLGVGVLYLRAGVGLAPILVGGGQERGLRPSTEWVAGICGASLAIEQAAAGAVAYLAEVGPRREALWRRLAEIDGAARFTPPAPEALPNTLFCGFHGVPGERLAILLDLEGVCVSTGSACASGAAHTSEVLHEMGVSAERAATALRISLDRSTTDAELARATKAIAGAVAHLRAQAPV